jgi:hypothetical protein
MMVEIPKRKGRPCASAVEFPVVALSISNRGGKMRYRSCVYRDGSRRPTLSQNKGDNSYPYYERDGELLGQQTGQFLGRF